MEKIVTEIQNISRDLLKTQQVSSIIGYTKGTLPSQMRPFTITSENDVEKLEWNERCYNNLALYLIKQHKPAGKVGIITKGCDIRSIIMLINETQIKREDVKIIAVSCSGMKNKKGEYLAKCYNCKVASSPTIHDYLIGDGKAPEAEINPVTKKIEELDNMTSEQRWEFWQEQLSKCVKCYGCRQICPLCYCDQCLTDVSMPQWVETSSHERGNLAYHLMRAWHLAGRCINCGECERACPVNIPLNLIYQKLAGKINELYDYEAGMKEDAPLVLRTYKPNDDQSFIL